MSISRRDAEANPVLKAALERDEKRDRIYPCVTTSPGSAMNILLDGASEADVMTEICAALEMQAYCTPARWKPGRQGLYLRAGQRNAKKGGSDAGLADLMVVRLKDRKWFHFEAKARTKEAAIRPEQKLMADMGVTYIVRSGLIVLNILENN